ncbi:high glucose sensor Rgt2p [[Candida] railenensis]|uniref:High glucose sensor Rgt2p n=1 Tax=[Candida] railenensis TaxID=45579 RepID=A0A9P0QLU8_9ASCO|nr:high glucose sensor Rgt2p [[Candida] railenensis]
MWAFIDNLFYDQTVVEEYDRKIRQKSSSGSAIIVGLVAAVGGFMYGYDTGLINDIMEMHYVINRFAGDPSVGFTVHERALTTAILSLGTFIGALIAPLLSDTYGRKTSIIFSSGIIFNIGNILQISATKLPLLCVGRGVSGVAVGILSAIVPLYQSEASPKWVRGSIIFTYQWAITWGLLIASAICQGTRTLKSSGSFRIPIGLQFLWALILCVGMLFLPESPRYYVQKNRIQSALESLSKLRRLPSDDADLIEELVDIKANYDYELSFGRTSLWDCFRNGGGRHKQILRMMTGMGIQALQQCSGINFIFYYGTNFFASTGMKNYYLMSFITYAVNMVFTIPGIILVEIIGRRLLLLVGGCGMSLSNLIIAIVGITVTNNSISSIICISFSCIFIAFFASSWGGCVWALSGEIFGISIRQKAISVSAASNWLVNFIFAYITPYLIDTGNHTAALGNKIFFIWGGFNAIGVVFVYFMVYETRGLKLEEVDFMYANCKSARDSSNFKSNQKVDHNMQEPAPGSDDKDHLVTTGGNSYNTDETKYVESKSQDFSPLQMVPMIVHPKSSSPHHSMENEQATVQQPPVYPASIDSTSDASASDQVDDYQMYLHSLRTEMSEGLDTSFTSASISRDKMFNPTKANFTEEDINKDANLVNSKTIIAAPFFNAPPSDSDTSDDESSN